MEFKLSPLILFIILLLALALSAMWKTYLEKEGFITYNKDSALFSTKTVGIYSTENPVTKIYDDIYYDPRNGNIVVVYTKTKSQSATDADADGTTIKSIEIVPRKYDSSPSGKIVSYENTTIDKTEIVNGATVSKATAINQVVPESRKSTLDAIDVAWSYKSGQNQVNYITWGSNTYIYVMNIDGLETAGNSNAYAGNSYAGTIKHGSVAFYTGSINPLVSIDLSKDDENGDTAEDIYIDSKGYPQQFADGYDDKTVIEPYYHPSRVVYQITSKIKYDIGNGNLLVIKTPTADSKNVDVYYRSGDGKREDDSTPDIQLTSVADAQASGLDYIKQSFNKSVNKPFFVQDTATKNTIMYWPIGENTLIVIFENRNANGYVPIKKVVRFTSNGVYVSSGSSGDKKDDKKDEKKDEKKDDKTIGDISGNYGDFWKWWSYFNSNAVGGISNDYMLKTQIVPPVCPSCPACSGGACTNCGGAGGSGTMAADGSSLAVKGPSSAVASLGQSAGATISNTADTVGSTIQGTAAVGGLTAVTGGAIAANLASKTLDTAGNVVGKTVDTAGNVVGKTIDVAGNVINRTFDTAGNVVNTTGGLIRDTGTGVSNLLSVDPRRVGYEQSYNGPRPGSNYTGIYAPLNQNQRQQGQTIDPYSYNGALQSKGNNFRPVTTDFSAFGL